MEVIQGPQALLYGQNGAGGAINMVAKQARLARQPFGSFTFTVDQYGSKNGQIDYGMGNHQVAMRVALINQTIGGRRVNIGGPLKGFYFQFAVAASRLGWRST